MQNNMDDMNKEEVTPFISFETAWANLKPELDAEAARREKRKKRVLFFWLTSIAIGLGIGVFVFESNQSKINAVTSKYGGISKIDDKHETMIKTQSDYSTRNITQSYIDKQDAVNNGANGNLSLPVQPKRELHQKQQSIALKKSLVATSHISQGKSLNSADYQEQHLGKSTKQLKSLSGASIDKQNGNGLDGSKGFQQENYLAVVDAIAINDNTNTQVNTSGSMIVASNSIDTIKKILDTTSAKSNLTKTSSNTTNKTAVSKSSTIHYGLQWNFPAQGGVNFLDVNSVNQPATLLIPELFVSKQFSKKHSLILGFNPYAQYYLSNKAVVDFTKYDAIVYSGSQSNTKPEEITYTEATAFNKLISMEASLLYQYQISSKIKIGFGISNNWVQAALMQNKVVKNGSFVTRDSLFGIDNTDKNWTHLKTSFLLGKLEVQYNVNRFDIGICFSKPLSSPFDNSQYKTPVNTGLFVRWTVK